MKGTTTPVTLISAKISASLCTLVPSDSNMVLSACKKSVIMIDYEFQMKHDYCVGRQKVVNQGSNKRAKALLSRNENIYRIHVNSCMETLSLGKRIVLYRMGCEVTHGTTIQYKHFSFHYFFLMVCGINPLTILFCACGTVTGNAKKKMSNPQYYTIYLIWMLFCVLIEYVPSISVRSTGIALTL